MVNFVYGTKLRLPKPTDMWLNTKYSYQHKWILDDLEITNQFPFVAYEIQYKCLLNRYKSQWLHWLTYILLIILNIVERYTDAKWQNFLEKTKCVL